MKTPAADQIQKPDASERLAAMPALFRNLMEQPLRPLTRARLPERAAVYLFYEGEEPVGVGSPPHLPEVRMLAPSVRLSLAASLTPVAAGRPQLSVGPLRDAPSDRPPPLTARWLPLEDDDDRMLLELYTAQSLGLSVSHPRIRAGLA
jgi:hypothetical protein